MDKRFGQDQPGCKRVRERVVTGHDCYYQLAANRNAWIQVARGSVSVNGQELRQGDGAAISNEAELNIRGGKSRKSYSSTCRRPAKRLPGLLRAPTGFHILAP